MNISNEQRTLITFITLIDSFESINYSEAMDICNRNCSEAMDICSRNCSEAMDIDSYVTIDSKRSNL